jgi:hypothetical protein
MPCSCQHVARSTNVTGAGTRPHLEQETQHVPAAHGAPTCGCASACRDVRTRVRMPATAPDPGSRRACWRHACMHHRAADMCVTSPHCVRRCAGPETRVCAGHSCCTRTHAVVMTALIRACPSCCPAQRATNNRCTRGTHTGTRRRRTNKTHITRDTGGAVTHLPHRIARASHCGHPVAVAPAELTPGVQG